MSRPKYIEDYLSVPAHELEPGPVAGLFTRKEPVADPVGKLARKARRSRRRPRTKAGKALVLRFRYGGSFPIEWLEGRLADVEDEARA